MVSMSKSSTTSSLVDQESEEGEDHQPPRSINQLIELMQQYDENHNDHEPWECPDGSNSRHTSHSHPLSSAHFPAIQAPATETPDAHHITLQRAQSKWREVLALVSAMQFGINLMMISMGRIEHSANSGIYGESFVVIAIMFTSAGRDKFGRILATAEKDRELNHYDSWATARYTAITMPIFLLMTVTELWYMFILFFKYTPELIFATFDQQSVAVLNVARLLAAAKLFVMCIGFVIPCLFSDPTIESAYVVAPRRSPSAASTSSRLSEAKQASM